MTKKNQYVFLMSFVGAACMGHVMSHTEPKNPTAIRDKAQILEPQKQHSPQEKINVPYASWIQAKESKLVVKFLGHLLMCTIMAYLAYRMAKIMGAEKSLAKTLLGSFFVLSVLYAHTRMNYSNEISSFRVWFFWGYMLYLFIGARLYQMIENHSFQATLKVFIGILTALNFYIKISIILDLYYTIQALVTYLHGRLVHSDQEERSKPAVQEKALRLDIGFLIPEIALALFQYLLIVMMPGDSTIQMLYTFIIIYFYHKINHAVDKLYVPLV